MAGIVFVLCRTEVTILVTSKQTPVRPAPPFWCQISALGTPTKA